MRTLAATFLLLAAPLALAKEGPPLDLDEVTAQQLKEAVSATRAEARALKEDLQAEATLLGEAREAGDVKAMKRGLSELRSLKRALTDLDDDLASDTARFLSLEQQVDFALIRSKRRAEHERAARPEVDVPAFEPAR